MATTRDNPEKRTAVEQTLTGLQAPGSPTSCTGCGTTLRDGTPIVARATQPANATTWRIPRVYCRPCHGDRIRTPTLGARDALATATLAVTQSAAEQDAYSVLSDVRVLDHSPATEGGMV